MSVRVHVVRVVAQVLGHHDANLDLDGFAAACGLGSEAIAAVTGTPHGTIVSLLRRDEMGGVLGPVSVLRCYVCDREIAEGDGVCDGRVRRVGIVEVANQLGAWAWGPVPVHEECVDSLRTPLDFLLGASHDRHWDTTPYEWARHTAINRTPPDT